MQSPLKYSCLFGGGAIRGLAYAGALRAIEELEIEIDTIGGSSVGSVFAMLVACGYKSYELENIFLKVNYDLFRDIQLGFNRDIALSKGQIFTDWLNELISKKLNTTSEKPVTFKDFDKNLVIITTNLEKFAPQEFSKLKTPKFEIAKAVKISSSMPGLMAPYKLGENSLADGDLQKGSPMWKLSENLSYMDSRILEFRLEGSAGETNSKSIISFLNTVYSCFTEVATNFISEIYGQNDKFDILKIETGNVFFADFNLNKDARRQLIESGYEQTMAYFKEFLPQKKKKLLSIYEKIYKYLKNSQKGLKSNNVEETQWWIGDLFILLCENKEFVDPAIYQELVFIKNLILDSVATILFIHTRFKDKQRLEEEYNKLLKIISLKISEIQYFLQKENVQL